MVTDSGTKCAWVNHESKAVQLHVHSNCRCLYEPRVSGSVKIRTTTTLYQTCNRFHGSLIAEKLLIRYIDLFYRVVDVPEILTFLLCRIVIYLHTL